METEPGTTAPKTVTNNGSLASTIFNLLFMVIVVIVAAILHFYPDIAYQRGFYCNDDSIKYPFHTDSVSVAAIVLFGVGIPVIAMFCIELKHYLEDRRKESYNGRVIEFHVKPFNCSFPPVIFTLYYQLGMFMMGFAAIVLLSDVTKVSVGRLRPHFLDVCRPDYDLFNCTTKDGLSVYITDYTCTGTDEKRIGDARKSFISDHTSASFYFAIYFCLYLQSRMTWPRLPSLLRPFSQLVAVALALYTGVTTVTDFKNHWSDSLVGALAGGAIAIITAYCVTRLFDGQQRGSDGSPPSDKVAIGDKSDGAELGQTDRPDQNSTQVVSGV